MRQLHVAVAQVHSKVCRPEENLQRHLRQVQSAACVGVEAILFAETSLHAYGMSPENLALAEPVGGPLTSHVGKWAKQYNMTIMAGFLERRNGDIHNSHVIARPDGTLASQAKHVITPPEIKGGLKAGPRERLVIEINGVRCALIICADGGMPGLDEMLLAQGVEYKFCPTAGGDGYNGGKLKYQHEEDLLTPEGRARYEELRARVFIAPALLADKKPGPLAGFASANALGYDGVDITHQGHCIIADNYGVVRAQIPGTTVLEHQQDQMVHAVLNFA